jgi:hypothetical protein
MTVISLKSIDTFVFVAEGIMLTMKERHELPFKLLILLESGHYLNKIYFGHAHKIR